MIISIDAKELVIFLKEKLKIKGDIIFSKDNPVPCSHILESIEKQDLLGRNFVAQTVERIIVNYVKNQKK